MVGHVTLITASYIHMICRRSCYTRWSCYNCICGKSFNISCSL